VDERIRHQLENIDLGFLDQLQAGDVLFIDNSHGSFQNSDFTAFLRPSMTIA
jgi:hypothetical protein